MGDKTAIEWTDATWNPVTGCTKVSQGCKHCYAEGVAERFWKGRPFTDVQCHPDRLDIPLRWQRPRRIFVNSMSDLFHEDVPFEFIAKVFFIMSVTTRHTYQVLTKRPKRMLEFFEWVRTYDDGERIEDSWHADRRINESPILDTLDWKATKGGRGGYDNCGPAFPYENVWIGVSVEDQPTADERIPLLLQTPAAVRWISAEPLLGPVNVGPYLSRTNMPGLSLMPGFRDPLPGLDWVVVGGESGHDARPMHPHWARALRDQCAIAGVPFLFKQWGEWVSVSEVAGEGPHHRFADGATVRRIGKKAAGRTLDGVVHDGYPA